MATILFAAAGAALGGAVGGSVFGLSSVVIGRAIGATVGRVIDQKLLGSGSEVVEGPRLNRFRVLGASEGSPVGRSYGRTRVGGQIIWTTRFKERVSKKSAGGKGGGGGGEVRTYSYSVSLAVALGEGEISSIGRVWADGVEVPRNKLDMRVYSGTEDQLPDPLMEAIEGAGNVPAYRGLAYVVLENMQLADYGNRVPQLSFEVIRPTDGSKVPDDVQPIGSIVRGVALVPGSGEYSLATSQVRKRTAPGRTSLVNVSTNAGETDFLVSMRQLEEEVPSCEAVSLVVSWFGNDLRAGHCFLKPKVEQKQTMIDSMPWIVSAATRDVAEVVPYVDGRPIYGGTPADESVIEAIQALKAQGKHVTFYPFILMDQMEGNTLPNPWTGATGQPHLPWRGRITTSLAPGVAGSPDGTAAAASEVADFFGDAEVSNFTPDGKSIFYTGPTEWSYRRFILHYARLCALAGGVDAFCIGSEMRALTQIRGEDDTFPAVSALIALAQDVRAVLGPNVKIGYAADWSEYFGYQPQDGSGDVFFHLDPLWSAPEIDFIGIDNYMPLSDWRDGTDHLDAIEGWPSVYDMDYLRGGVAGGEGFDWYYPDQAARDTQTRAPITDGAYGEPWVFRYKDLRGWWENPHHNRKGGVRQADPTDWAPQSKPFWFTEFGCAALDKSTNQPNKFLDPKSSESRLAHYSNGRRDEFIQAQYLRAVTLHWADAAQNPVSPVYGGPMVDMSKAHVWAWDVRPYPAFPARSDLWSDGANYDRGHWLNGRTSNEALAAVISDICARSGMTDIDVSSVIGNVRGFEMETGQGARAALQPLMLAYGLDASEREGSLVFSMRGTPVTVEIGADMLAVSTEFEGDLERLRESAPEIPDRVQLNSVKSGSDFSAQAVEAVFPGETVQTTAQSELPLVMTQGEAQSVADRWLAEARVSRDSVRLSLPPSALWVGAGDTVSIDAEGHRGTYRIDRVEQGAGQLIDAVRIEAGIYAPGEQVAEDLVTQAFMVPVPVEPIFMDLPLLTGSEDPIAPHLAVAAEPWPGQVSVYASTEDAGYALNTVLETPAAIGITLDDLPAAAPGRWDRGPSIRIRLSTEGPLAAADRAAVFAGANAFAIGTGSVAGWEIVQFVDAELVEPDTYAVSLRLRGQAGTDAEMPESWPAGSLIVMLDGAPGQITVPASARGLTRHYRVGPSGLALDDPAYTHLEAAFSGIGLRPYAPAHLKAREDEGDLAISWIRRTRFDGDSWLGEDVPLGEEQERYRLRVLDGDGAVLREAELSEPQWTYSAGDRIADGGAAAVVEVAQVSTQFGAGPYKRIEIDG